MNLFQKKKSNSFSKPVKNKFFLTGLLDFFLLLANFAIVGCLFLGDVACLVSPIKFVIPSYFGLAFPLIALFTILFLVFWIVRLKWYFLVSLTALLISHQSIYNTFPLNGEKVMPKNLIKVLSYNVHLFNFYTPLSQNKVLEYIARSDADILCLQEFGFSSVQKKNYLKKSEIFKKLQQKYPYYHIDLTQIKKSGSYGVATFSKYPILYKGNINYDSRYNSTIYSDVLIRKKKVRIFNCHLESNNLTENDKVLIKKLGEDFNNDKINEVVEHLSQKLGNSFRLRAKQADRISVEITKTATPIILCGDFNDVPVSYAYTKIKGNRLYDSFTECGNGYGYTFNERFFWFRIDQIMHSKELQAFRFKINKVEYSDHYPIECYMALKEKD